MQTEGFPGPTGGDMALGAELDRYTQLMAEKEVELREISALKIRKLESLLESVDKQLTATRSSLEEK